jgi:hypothetical protein
VDKHLIEAAFQQRRRQFKKAFGISFPFVQRKELHVTMENITLEAHLRSALPQDGTREALISSVIPRLLQSIADVAQALRDSHHVAAAGTANTFGDNRVSLPSFESHDEYSLTP